MSKGQAAKKGKTQSQNGQAAKRARHKKVKKAENAVLMKKGKRNQK